MNSDSTAKIATSLAKTESGKTPKQLQCPPECPTRTIVNHYAYLSVELEEQPLMSSGSHCSSGPN
ncbi:hypothetical protein F441_05885 [Phytophthora nicotianae CJ01A1]|uniref:Uncharacterized protein n=6 Tax=Phytophthora nicotianae TaxID=4792 RepID=W2PCX0_PHYN3|nr:hypothetical protein PPTG_24735 [Phytophthora nicotianae INRA-310]ETI50605.1 hypothetical protein F443_05880 [Phytophthora nicotianae P1569]ETK90062.1 hypothetical protein L915_06073 [Phytophthora nicotianae]ETO78902.1 hypothetical protein F444_06258 [Phytophthora nicotianae P1976]ETP20376.1 hypothetical protein F441_05885 [Phytophthora nicotianae CJ01A1]ETP47886.1 hypothetical protein F442_06238 [Phytophthora nicotianae P10297]